MESSNSAAKLKVVGVGGAGGNAINDMMQSDIKLMKKELYLKEGGYNILNYFE